MLTGIPLLLLIVASIVLIVLASVKWKLHPFLALILACFFLGLTVQMPMDVLLNSMTKGFGDLMAYIGLIVVFGSVIGVFLERSGAALRIAHTISDLFGRGKSIAAISLIGAVVSIPVFCDSGFILLSGLSKKLAKVGKQSQAAMGLALATGLYTTHTLVPPTPGPIAVAGNIGAEKYLGTIILWGIGFSIPVLWLGQLMAKRLGKNISLRQAEIQAEERFSSELPALWKALLPILLPIALIALGTLTRFLGIENGGLHFLSHPVVAIFIGALLALFLLGPTSTAETGKGWFTEAVKISGPILILTGGGGAFGGVLKATPLKDYVGVWLGSGDMGGFWVLVAVFIIAAVLKSAQGSSTSAMVVTATLLAPLVPALGWSSPSDYALAVMAIGGGAMTVSHYNDSYFWVVSQFGGLSPKDTHRSFTLLTGIQGVAVLVLTLLAWGLLSFF
ncbi:GntP family permease [Sediminicola luteus]|uniref:Gluconate transporter n=1 Tax=Sediminicola luteus TaxID=319238 RepID=A0A2A4GBB4_9FLAO|nr:GntP family permease [Sediminicola luteus]PCE66249.1 hypothetical protein B7P33_02825 [Sediminicola luteus]